MPTQTMPSGTITATLKGPVRAIYSEMVPEFGRFDGDRFYDLVMENSELLHACLYLFRRRQRRFADLLKDSKGRAVNDEFVPLPCGRTLREIITLIVRAHAKTHFGVVLTSDPGNPRTPAGRLYRAFRDYLLHDWQTRLVPAYARLSVPTVNELGPAILDARDLPSLQALVAAVEGPPRDVPAGETAIFVPAAQSSLVQPPQAMPQPAAALELPEGVRPLGATAPVRPPPPKASQFPELFWRASNDPDVVAVIGACPADQMRDLVAVVGNVGSAVQRELSSALQFDGSQLFVCLVKCLDIVGRASFIRIFSEPGDTYVLGAIARRMAAKGVGSDTPPAAIQAALDEIIRTDPRTGLVILPG